MRFNAHLIQSQNNVGDIGENPGAAAGHWEINPYTIIANNDRDVEAGVTGSEKSYRNAYINKIYCSKKDASGVKYNKFYDGNTILVEPNEIPTMGQISDWLLNNRDSDWDGGVLCRIYGDAKSTDNNTNMYNSLFTGSRYASGGSFLVPDNWDNLNLLNKLNEVFNRLFNVNSGEYGFNVHAAGFYGGSLTVGESNADYLKIRNLDAGCDTSPFDNPIFQITGQNGTAQRQIKLLYNQGIGTGTPNQKSVGIAGPYYTGENHTQYGTERFTFVDVTRYILREELSAWGDQHDDSRHRDGIFVWLSRFYYNYQSNACFSFGNTAASVAGRVLIEKPDDLCYAVTTRPLSSSPLDIYCYTSGGSSYDFKLNFNNDNTTGLSLARNTSSAITYFRYLDDRFAIRNGIISNPDNIDMFFNWIGAITADGKNVSNLTVPYNRADHHMLCSDACERIYGSTSGKYLLFSMSNTKTATPINYCGLGIYYNTESGVDRYSFSAYETDNGGVEYICKMPAMELLNDCKFIISKPYESSQSINKDLTVTGTVTTQQYHQTKKLVSEGDYTQYKEYDIFASSISANIVHKKTYELTYSCLITGYEVSNPITLLTSEELGNLVPTNDNATMHIQCNLSKLGNGTEYSTSYTGLCVHRCLKESTGWGSVGGSDISLSYDRSKISLLNHSTTHDYFINLKITIIRD